MIQEWTGKLGFTALAVGLLSLSVSVYLDHAAIAKLEAEKASIVSQIEVQLKHEREINQKIEQYLKVCGE